MKLYTLMCLSFVSSAVYAGCGVYAPQEGHPDVRSLLEERGYSLSTSKVDTSFELKIKQDVIKESYLLVMGGGRVIIQQKPSGVYTQLLLTQQGRYFVDGQYETHSPFRGEHYSPSDREYRRSYRKALRDLKDRLPDCGK